MEIIEIIKFLYILAGSEYRSSDVPSSILPCSTKRPDICAEHLGNETFSENQNCKTLRESTVRDLKNQAQGPMDDIKKLEPKSTEIRKIQR